MSLRAELIALMNQPQVNVSELCRRFGVSRKTAYKWKKRSLEQSARPAPGSAPGSTPGASALGASAPSASELSFANRSRRPRRSPRLSAATIESAVVQLRRQHPAWGGRKIARRLKDLDQLAPAPSTVSQILTRHGLITPEASQQSTAWKRFEHAAPNDLWQMDFKGHFALSDAARCHPLTLLDDHARYSLGLFACCDEQYLTVQKHLTTVFKRYGLPRCLLADNGPPWGVSHTPGAYTRLELWLLRMDVRLLHGRPWHPQTQGKEERFHRSLKAEVLRENVFDSLSHVQMALDRWRQIYNQQRPHEALELATPVKRYVMSHRSMPELLPKLEYEPMDQLRRVNATGSFSFKGQSIVAGEAFAGERIGLRATVQKGLWDVQYGRHRVGVFNEELKVMTRLRDKQWPIESTRVMLEQP